MEINFFNNCNYVVEIFLDSKERINKIQPYGYITILGGENREITFSIHRDKKSYKNKGKYIIEINTQYSIANYNEGEVIRISCEKDQINHNIYFERLYLEINAVTIMPDSYSVFGEKDIISIFNKSWRADFFVFYPLMCLISKSGFLLIAFGIYLLFTYGIDISLIYFLIIYTSIIVVNLFIEKVWNKLIKRVFKMDDDKTEFYNYLSKDFIFHFYKNRK